MRIEPHSDLTIEITRIEFTPTQILIDALPVFTKNKKPFHYPISRALNEDIVNKLKIGNEYRITQERIITGRKVDYKWTSIKCLNDSQQKARIFNGLFE
jgi:hypothetical protein